MSEEKSASDNKLAEFDVLCLPARSLRRLAELLDAEANGTISPSDLAQLEGVKEAALYLRMYHNQAA
jgi:hypothetical protein